MRTRFLRHWSTAALAVSTTASLLIVGALAAAPAASATPAPVGLGTAVFYAVLAGSTVTNTGPTTVSGNLGLSPGSSVTGAPHVINGTQHVDDSAAVNAKNDLTKAYNQAAAAPSTHNVTGVDLGGHTYTEGVYTASSSMGLTGPVTLNGNASAVFIFQAGSTLVTASNSTVNLIGGAQACNVFWQVGSSATLGTNTTFVGTIMASASATLNTGATVAGRVLAQVGAVTLDTNTITASSCTSPSTPTTVGQGGGGSSGGGSGGGHAKGTTNGSPNGNGLGGGSNGNGLGGGVVPTGFPATGLGGASHSDDPAMVAFGGLALLGAAVAAGQAWRRRRIQLATTTPGSGGPDGGA